MCDRSENRIKSRDRNSGDVNAVFADGHIAWVNYESDGWFDWRNPKTDLKETIGNTVMYCTDGIPASK